MWNQTEAVAHFARKLGYETDPSDVAAARAAGEPITVIDVRGQVAWDQGHLPGALHIPGGEIVDRLDEIPRDAPIVVYCWGPGCNGSTRAALALAQAGIAAKELIGGFEYWAREGLAVETATGRTRRPIDDLTAPLSVQARTQART
jgi:rhodanese-related sulfurtransferase